MTEKTNIILIGMPGAGKSTLGVLLSKKLGLDFIDTDVAIQVHAGDTLQHIVDQQGYMRLREIEQEVIVGLRLSGAVVATGGSAVYGSKSMQYLARHAVIVFIDVAFDELCKRVNDFGQRGIARKPGQDFADLYRERRALYQQYADICIEVSDETVEQVLAMTLAGLDAYRASG